MSTETIDEMMVRIGLDSSQFAQGQKQAADSIESLRSSVTTSAEGMGASIAGVLGKFSAFTLGVAGLAGAIDLVKNMAFEFKNLAIQAEALGSSTRTLRTLQEFSSFVGAPQGAGAQFGQQGLSSVYGLIYGPLARLGQIGGLASLGFENPWGAVAEETQNPKRFYEQLILHTKEQLPQIMAVNPFGLSPEANVAQTLQARLPGLPESFAAMVGKSAVSANPLETMDKLWDRAAKRNESVSERTARAATEAANAMIDLKFGVENTATRGFGVLDVGIGLANSALSLFDDALDVVTKTLNDMENSTVFKFWQKEFGTTAKPGPVLQGVEKYAHWAYEAGKLAFDANLKVPELVGTALGDAAGWVSATAFPAVENELIKNYPTAADPFSIGMLSDLAPIAPLKLPPFVPHALPIPPSLGALHSSIAAGAQHHDNSLSIGHMTVNTQATDATGVAAGMHAAVARKFNVSQADSGVTQ